MDLRTLRQTITESAPKDWNHIICWGYGSGPIYHHGLTSEYKDNRIQTEARSHSNMAVLSTDIDISIAWGYDPDDSLWNRGHKQTFDFNDFLPQFPDDKVSRMYVDVFYRGALVDRKLYIVADGARYYVPIPRRAFPNKTSTTDLGEPEFHYTSWDLGLARIVSSFELGESFDELLQRLNYILDDDDTAAIY
ncbi:hypothetical protein [Mycobacterium marinum]|uniref:hypothetical protein n=1 Tax=Mycobacterium marinum TaxID=1781 RepID=UPI00045FCEB5|nr:hypothetical protein [Mycobacterium marinum]CDM76135.1 hypothetical protein MMARE11_19880 [Mycobacterium marinum E11]